MFKKMRVNFFKSFFVLLFFLILPLFVLAAPSSEDSVSSLGENDPDAIAIRVIPNPENYNIQQWYKMQGFTGSPQSLIVDGYKAIRDGRTVYISAANIDLENNKIYFNIYLISYNQEADDNTIDIFGKILKNWKLNTNLKDKIGHCSISSKICKSETDCPSGYICGGYVGQDSAHLLNDSSEVNVVGKIYQKNRCIIKEDDYNKEPVNTPACLLDSDCPNNLFCDSPKSMLIRDVERLEKLKIIKTKLEAYKNLNGHYPILSSGTYVPYVAISSWPSWQQTFLNQISVSGVTDSINRISSCYDENSNFDLLTCWENDKAVFLSTEKPVNYTNFVLPEYSSVFSYVSDPKGLSASIYSPMESSEYWGESFTLPSGENTDDFNPPYIPVDDELPQYNNPYFEEALMTGHSGTSFEGYIKAKDPRDQALSWVVSGCIPGKPLYPDNTIITDCSESNWSSWTPNKYPARELTNSDETILLKSTIAGDSQPIDSPTVQEKNKRYIIGVSVKNSSGYETIKNFPIYIANQNPSVQVSSNYSSNLSSGQDFSFPISINDKSKLQTLIVCQLDLSNNCVNTCEIKPDVDKLVEFTGSALFNNKLVMVLSILDANKESYSLVIKNKYSINTPNVFNSSHVGTHRFKITAKDPHQAQTSVNFNITFTADAPSIVFNNCSNSVALNNNYSCEISSSKPGEYITVDIIEKPSFLTFSAANKTLSGVANSLGAKTIKAKITNSFGMSSEGTHNFSVFTKPEVETVSHSDVTSNSFKCNGRIISAGGNYVGGRGCVTSPASSNLSIANVSSCASNNGCSYEASISDNSSYIHTLSDLTRNYLYYYRAYAVNQAGISYGATKSFKTRADYPVVTVNQQTLASGNINFSGYLSDNGGGDLVSGSAILAMGFVWSTSASSLETYIGACSLNVNNCILANSPYAIGTFSKGVSVSKFTPGVTYYFKSFAMNRDSYGDRVGVSSDTKTFVLPVAPSISTTNVSNITSSSATSGGTISNPSNVSISECGLIYWSNDSSHFVSETKVVSSSCSGSFSLTMSNLFPGIEYSVKSYITSSFGTVYGSTFPFTTKTTSSVSYNGNGQTGGTAPATQTGDTGTNVTIAGQGGLVKTGYNFVGWNTKTDGTGSNYLPNAVIQIPSTGLILYAKWTPFISTVNLDSQGGTSGTGSVVATYGSAMPTAISPVRSGYSFGGYYNQTGGLGSQYYTNSMSSARTWDMTTSPVTLYAKWTPITYSVIFDKNDASATGTMASQSIISGASANLTLNQFVKPGYSFAGWATSSTGSVIYSNGASYTMGTASVTLYAKWTANTYTISFNADGGSVLPSSKIVTYNSAIGTLPTPTKSGSMFSDWFTGINGTGTRYTSSTIYNQTSNITLYAKWVSAVTLPTVTIAPTSSITTGSAVSGGNVTSDGGATVTERGVVYSKTSTLPTTSTGTKIVSGSGTGAFTSNITGLTPGSMYYVRAYAINSAGTAYSSLVANFTTLSMPRTLTVFINGYEYGSNVSVQENGSYKGNCTDFMCEYTVNNGSTINLEASAYSPTVFENWTGPCFGSQPYCSFTISSDTHVYADFGCYDSGGSYMCFQ